MGVANLTNVPAGTGSRRQQERRSAAATQHCVVALTGSHWNINESGHSRILQAPSSVSTLVITAWIESYPLLKCPYVLSAALETGRDRNERLQRRLCLCIHCLGTISCYFKVVEQ